MLTKIMAMNKFGIVAFAAAVFLTALSLARALEVSSTYLLRTSSFTESDFTAMRSYGRSDSGLYGTRLLKNPSTSYMTLEISTATSFEDSFIKSIISQGKAILIEQSFSDGFGIRRVNFNPLPSDYLTNFSVQVSS